MIALPGFHSPARSSFALALLIISIALSGCATKPTTAGAAKIKPTQTKPASKESTYPEASEETLKSYAHYAAGLSLDMREDPAAALDEYVKAAENNPAEEPLVLEVSRRLVRNKQADRAIVLLSKAAEQPT